MNHVTLRLAAFLMIVCTGCSYTALKKLPSNHGASDAFECSSDLTYPLIDTTITILAGVLAIALVSTGNDPGQNDQKIPGYVLGGASLGLASSAIYGAYHVNKCKSAQATDPANTTPPPNTQTPAPGKLGGKCSEDTDCSVDLSCDATMKLCVRIAEENL